ncbi:lipase member H-like isoform X3 [Mobula birostris]|uniref:lipase member H-like isoform X3 n=1 Tax=Mobula birostris TaxID=1983395 RepID=UPI003B27C14B
MLQWLTLFLCAIVIVSGAPECHYFTKLPITDTLIGTNVEVKLLLYMNKNSECASLINATHISPLDVKKKTIFLIHGYRPFGSPPNWLNKLIKTLLNVDDINLIIVDWNRGATTINYSTAVTNTKKVAEILKPVIDSILGNGGSLDLIHMIGVSLGAHISGFVGSMFGGKIGRITGKKYMVCDHQRSVYLYINSMNSSCNIINYPCASYAEFLDARCTQRDSTYPIFGYHLDKWTNHSSVMRFPNKVFFQTSSEEPYCMYYYLLDIIPWNKNARKGYITIELEDGNGLKVKSKDNHSAKTFEQFREVTLLVSVDRDLKNITGISLKYSSARVVEHKLTLGILRFKLRSLSYPDRPPLCRYDVALQRDEEVKVQPFECRVQEM